jgi:cytochrome c biogenesis factor
MLIQNGASTAQRFFILVSGLLFGGLCVVGFLVTPTLFNVLDDKQVAGMIAGEIFKNTSFFGLIVTVFLMIYANLMVKRGHLQFRSLRWYLLIATVLILIGTFVIQPMMEDWREIALENGAPVMQSSYAKRFALFHHISSVIFTVQVLLSAWVFWSATRLGKKLEN